MNADGTAFAPGSCISDAATGLYTGTSPGIRLISERTITAPGGGDGFTYLHWQLTQCKNCPSYYSLAGFFDNVVFPDPPGTPTIPQLYFTAENPLGAWCSAYGVPGPTNPLTESVWSLTPYIGGTPYGVIGRIYLVC